MVDIEAPLLVKEHSLSFLSPNFEPLKALYTKELQPPIPNIQIFNNLEEYARVIKQGKPKTDSQKESKKEPSRVLNKRTRNLKPEYKPVDIGTRLKAISRTEVGQNQLLSGEKLLDRSGVIDGSLSKDQKDKDLGLGRERSSWKKKYMNVLEKMDACSTGPLSILYNCLEKRYKVQVWIRKYKGLRSVLTGYVIAFDKHMNLALMDVDEVYTTEEHHNKENLNEKEKVTRKKKKKKKKKHIKENDENRIDTTDKEDNPSNLKHGFKFHQNSKPLTTTSTDYVSPKHTANDLMPVSDPNRPFKLLSSDFKVQKCTVVNCNEKPPEIMPVKGREISPPSATKREIGNTDKPSGDQLAVTNLHCTAKTDHLCKEASDCQQHLTESVDFVLPVNAKPAHTAYLFSQDLSVKVPAHDDSESKEMEFTLVGIFQPASSVQSCHDKRLTLPESVRINGPIPYTNNSDKTEEVKDQAVNLDIPIPSDSKPVLYGESEGSNEQPVSPLVLNGGGASKVQNLQPDNPVVNVSKSALHAIYVDDELNAEHVQPDNPVTPVSEPALHAIYVDEELNVQHVKPDNPVATVSEPVLHDQNRNRTAPIESHNIENTCSLSNEKGDFKGDFKAKESSECFYYSSDVNEMNPENPTVISTHMAEGCGTSERMFGSRNLLESMGMRVESLAIDNYTFSKSGSKWTEETEIKSAKKTEEKYFSYEETECGGNENPMRAEVSEFFKDKNLTKTGFCDISMAEGENDGREPSLSEELSNMTLPEGRNMSDDNRLLSSTSKSNVAETEDQEKLFKNNGDNNGYSKEHEERRNLFENSTPLAEREAQEHGGQGKLTKHKADEGSSPSEPSCVNNSGVTEPAARDNPDGLRTECVPSCVNKNNAVVKPENRDNPDGLNSEHVPSCVNKNSAVVESENRDNSDVLQKEHVPSCVNKNSVVVEPENRDNSDVLQKEHVPSCVNKNSVVVESENRDNSDVLHSEHVPSCVNKNSAVVESENRDNSDVLHSEHVPSCVNKKSAVLNLEENRRGKREEKKGNIQDTEPQQDGTDNRKEETKNGAKSSMVVTRDGGTNISIANKGEYKKKHKNEDKAMESEKEEGEITSSEEDEPTQNTQPQLAQCTHHNTDDGPLVKSKKLSVWDRLGSNNKSRKGTTKGKEPKGDIIHRSKRREDSIDMSKVRGSSRDSKREEYRPSREKCQEEKTRTDPKTGGCQLSVGSEKEANKNREEIDVGMNRKQRRSSRVSSGNNVQFRTNQESGNEVTRKHRRRSRVDEHGSSTSNVTSRTNQESRNDEVGRTQRRGSRVGERDSSASDVPSRTNRNTKNDGKERLRNREMKVDDTKKLRDTVGSNKPRKEMDKMKGLKRREQKPSHLVEKGQRRKQMPQSGVLASDELLKQRLVSCGNDLNSKEREVKTASGKNEGLQSKRSTVTEEQLRNYNKDNINVEERRLTRKDIKKEDNVRRKAKDSDNVKRSKNTTHVETRRESLDRKDNNSRSRPKSGETLGNQCIQTRSSDVRRMIRKEVSTNEKQIKPIDRGEKSNDISKPGNGAYRKESHRQIKLKDPEQRKSNVPEDSSQIRKHTDLKKESPSHTSKHELKTERLQRTQSKGSSILVVEEESKSRRSSLNENVFEKSLGNPKAEKTEDKQVKVGLLPTPVRDMKAMTACRSATSHGKDRKDLITYPHKINTFGAKVQKLSEDCKKRKRSLESGAGESVKRQKRTEVKDKNKLEKVKSTCDFELGVTMRHRTGNEMVSPTKSIEREDSSSVCTARRIEIGRGKYLEFKRRHVNQLFVRGDNVVMISYAVT